MQPWFSCKETPFFNSPPGCLGRASWTTGSTSDQRKDHIPFLQRLVCSNWFAQTKPIKVTPSLSWIKMMRLVELCEHGATGGHLCHNMERIPLRMTKKSIQKKRKKERYRGTACTLERSISKVVHIVPHHTPALDLDLVLETWSLNWWSYPPTGQSRVLTLQVCHFFSSPPLMCLLFFLLSCWPLLYVPTTVAREKAGNLNQAALPALCRGSDEEWVKNTDLKGWREGSAWRAHAALAEDPSLVPTQAETLIYIHLLSK